MADDLVKEAKRLLGEYARQDLRWLLEMYRERPAFQTGTELAPRRAQLENLLRQIKVAEEE